MIGCNGTSCGALDWRPTARSARFGRHQAQDWHAMAQVTRPREATRTLKAADSISEGVVVILSVMVCFVGAAVSVTCTEMVTPTLASSSLTMVVSSSAVTSFSEARVSSALGVEAPSGMVMSYLTSTEPAKRRAGCKRRLDNASQETSTLLASCFEARARDFFKPSMTFSLAQKAAGSSTVILSDPDTTVFVRVPSGADVVVPPADDDDDDDDDREEARDGVTVKA
mmetsp:Transcript_104824/g.291756  ORF Transcript_104824/g.291756 Transcript_104824/m.291756 type:complete len:226 (-) Transcript_104824:202-879(-)